MDFVENFPWMKSVFQAFSRTFPGEYNDESLTLLHTNLQKELQKAVKNKDRDSLQKLFSCMRHLYTNFCWKFDARENYSCMKMSCVKLLSSVIQIGIILNEKTSTFNSINIILAALKIFPGTFEMLCDAFLLLNNLKKHHHEDFGLVLKQFLFTTKFDVQKPASYFKALLLLRRLKFLSKDNREKLRVVSLAEKVQAPFGCVSWLLENGIENVFTLKNRSIVNQFLNKKLPPTFFTQLRQVLQKEFDCFLTVNYETKSLVPHGIPIFTIDSERDECRVENAKEEMNFLNESSDETSVTLHRKEAESAPETSSLKKFNRKNNKYNFCMRNKKSEITVSIESSIANEIFKPGTEITKSVKASLKHCNQTKKKSTLKNANTPTSKRKIYSGLCSTDTNLSFKSDHLINGVPSSTSTEIDINKIASSSEALVEMNSENSESSNLKSNLDLSGQVTNIVPFEESGLMRTNNKIFCQETSQKENAISNPNYQMSIIKHTITKSAQDKCHALNTEISKVSSETDKNLSDNTSNYILNSKISNLDTKLNDICSNEMCENNIFKKVGHLDNIFQNPLNLENQNSSETTINSMSPKNLREDKFKDIVKPCIVLVQNLPINIETLSKDSSSYHSDTLSETLCHSGTKQVRDTLKKGETLPKYEKTEKTNSTENALEKEALDSYIGNVLYKLVSEVSNKIDNTSSFEAIEDNNLKDGVTPFTLDLKTNNVTHTSSLQKENNPFPLQKITECLSFSDVSLEEKRGDNVLSASLSGDEVGKFNGYRDLLMCDASDSASNVVVDEDDFNECNESGSEYESDSAQSGGESNQDVICEHSFGVKEAKLFVDLQPKLVVNLGNRCSTDNSSHCENDFKTESCLEDSKVELHDTKESKECSVDEEESTAPEGLFYQLNTNLNVISNEASTDSNKKLDNLKLHSPTFQTINTPSPDCLTEGSTVPEHVDSIEKENISVQFKAPSFESTKSTTTEKVELHMSLRKRKPVTESSNSRNVRSSKKRPVSKAMEGHDFNLIDFSKLTLGSPPQKRPCKAIGKEDQNNDEKKGESKTIKSYNLRSSSMLIKPSRLNVLK